jgi:hypothetical protein
MTGCGQRTGFLTLTTCDQPAVAVCIKCGKPICACHLQSDPSGPCCPDCAVLGLDPDEASRRGLDSSYYRQTTGRDTDMMSYSSSDYESFDSYGGEGGEMGGGGAGGEWGDESDSDDSADSDSGGAGDFQDS